MNNDALKQGKDEQGEDAHKRDKDHYKLGEEWRTWFCVTREKNEGTNSDFELSVSYTITKV